MPDPDFIPDAPDFIADTPDFVADDDPWWKKMAHEKLWATGPSLEQAGTGAMGVIDSAASVLRYPFDVGAEAVSGAMGIPISPTDPRRNALGVVPSNELLHIDDPKTRREDPIHRAMAGAVPGALPLASLLEAGGMPELGGRVLDLGAKPAELGLGFATDPSMVLGAGEGVAALRGAAPLVAGANRALGAAGAVSGGVGALRSGSEAVRAALEGRGWDAAMSGVDALTSGAMGLLGAHGAVAERPGVAETVRRATSTETASLRRYYARPGSDGTWNVVTTDEAGYVTLSGGKTKERAQALADKYNKDALPGVIPGRRRGVSQSNGLTVGDKWDSGNSHTVLSYEDNPALHPGEERVAEVMPDGSIVVHVGPDRVAAQVKGREPGSPRVTPAEVETAIAEAPREPAKQPWEMSLDELTQAHDAAKAYEKNVDVEVLGADLAKEYNSLRRTANGTSARADAAQARVDQIEASLTQEQRNRLFGFGETGPSAEDLTEFRRGVGALNWDSPQALGASLRWAITKIGDGTDPLKMNHEQQVAYAQMRAAYEGAVDAGWDPAEVSRAAAKAAAARFSDPEDAAFMLRRFAKEKQPTPRGLLAEAPQEPPAPERTLGDIPLDNVPESLREQSKAVSTKLGRTLADTGVIPEGAIESLPPELQPYAKDIHEDAVLRASSIVEGRDFLERTRATHGDAGPDGVTVAESQTPGSYDVLQRSGGKLVGAAAVRGDGLRMIAGGRAMDSPVSARGIYEVLDSRGVQRDDILSVLGAEARRKYAAGGSQGAREGAPVAGQGREAPPVPPASPEQAGGAARGAGTPEPAGGAGEVPDVTDPYIYGNLDETKPRSAGREVLRRLTSPLRATLTAVERIPVIGPKIAEVSRRYEQAYERSGARRYADILRIERDAKRAGLSWEELSDLAQVAPDQVPPQHRAVVGQFRKMDDGIWNRAVEAGVGKPEDRVENHYPRRPTDPNYFSTDKQIERVAAQHGISLEEAAAKVRGGKDVGVRITSASPFEASLQVAREGHVADWDKSRNGYVAYALDAERRIADAKHFGRNGENLQALVNSAARTADRDYLMTAMDRFRALPPDRTMHRMQKVSGNVRGATGFGALGLSAISQIGQVATTAGIGGVLRTAKGMWKAATGGRGVRGLRALAESATQARIDTSPSLYANISQEFAEGVGSRGFFGRAPHMKAINVTDALGRKIAHYVGEEYVPKMVEAAKRGDKSAQQVLKRMRIDYEKFDPSNPEHVQIGGKAFSDYTQLRTGVGRTPLWATHPIAKIAVQFKNVALQQALVVGDQVRLAAKGNRYAIANLARGAAAGALVGNGIGALKDAAKGYGIQAEDPGSWEKALAQFKKGRRVPAKVEYAPLWIAQGLMLGGVVGLLEETMRGSRGRQRSGKEVLAETLGGATTERVADVIDAGIAAKEKGPAAGAKALGAAAIRGYLPIWGREAARELSAKEGEYPERPGLVGRTRDVLQGAQDAAGAIRGGFLTGERSQRRQDSESAGMTAEDVAARVKAREELLPPSVKSPEERQASRVKRLTREEHLAKVIDAIRNGDEDEYRSAIREAARDRVRFSQRYLVGIRRRLGGNEVSQ